MIPTIPVHASSFRIFRGFKRSGLDDEAFLADLGQTFMPGTPLMLRDYGLAAYLPAVLPMVEGAEELPDEVAIIAYPSQEQYQRVRRGTVVGRMYTYTHLAVFDMDNSRSAFPEPIGKPTEDVTAFYCYGATCDWQADADVLFWAGRRGEVEPSAYPGQFLKEVGALAATLRERGVCECVGQTAAGWATLWLLLDRYLDAEGLEDLSGQLARSLSSSETLMTQTVSRQVWREELPSVEVTRGSSYSFIFPRDTRHFLR